MTKVIFKEDLGHGVELWAQLTIKRDLHTCRPNRYAVWEGDSWNAERKCLERGLTKEQAIQILNKY